MPNPYAISQADSTATAAAKILHTELINIEQFSARTLNQDDAAALHQLRVSLRRFRAALRLFRPHLPLDSAGTLNTQIAKLSAQLGPARDLDVWLAFLEATAREHPSTALSDYNKEQAALRMQQLPETCFMLESNYRYALAAPLHRFVEQALQAQQPSPATPGSAFTHFALAELYHLMLKTLQSPFPLAAAQAPNASNTKEATPDSLHLFRKRCRRIRYWNEFSIGQGAKVARKAAKRFKALANSLGNLRDLAAHKQRIDDPGLAPTCMNTELRGQLLNLIEAQLETNRQQSLRVWQALQSKKLRKNLKQAYKELKH